jgi:hypothetical protein
MAGAERDDALRAREVRPGKERGIEDCACRDTNTIVQNVAHLPSSAPWRNINCRPTAPIVAPSRRDRSCAFRQYRRVPPSSRRRWGNFPPARPVTGPGADAAAALISKFPAASGKKNCSETEVGAPLSSIERADRRVPFRKRITQRSSIGSLREQEAEAALHGALVVGHSPSKNGDSSAHWMSLIGRD